MPPEQNPPETVIRVSFLCPKCDNCSYLFRIKIEMKRWFLLPKSESSVNRSQAHIAKSKRTGWEIGINSWTNWILYGKFVSVMSSKCSIVEKDGELMLMALHAVSFSFFTSKRTYKADCASFLQKSVRNLRTHSATLSWFLK